MIVPTRRVHDHALRRFSRDRQLGSVSTSFLVETSTPTQPVQPGQFGRGRADSPRPGLFSPLLERDPIEAVATSGGVRRRAPRPLGVAVARLADGDPGACLADGVPTPATSSVEQHGTIDPGWANSYVSLVCLRTETDTRDHW